MSGREEVSPAPFVEEMTEHSAPVWGFLGLIFILLPAILSIIDARESAAAKH